MKEFDPIHDVEDSRLLLEDGAWPNFHEAEVHNLNLGRGDIRPDDHVWIGPVIEASFELCALEKPYIVVLKFHDCDAISMQAFNHQEVVYDLSFKYQERGHLNNGEPMTPYLLVSFVSAFDRLLSFRCFRVQALERREVLNH